MTKRFSIGPFELESVIGRGGMGEVWSGLHVSEGEPVAIKVMTQDGARDDDYLESFENEVRAVAGLSHPHIVTPLDYGEITAEQAAASGGVLVAGSPYIVMEMALRGSLRQYQNAMVWPQVKSTLLIMLDALAHAHAAGIVHRDLKPANILVGCGGQDPGLKLTDFGLARLSESFERSGSQETGWGTPHYMAPEQFRGRWRDYGPWTDLYALGIMAFELVTGVLPFEAKSAMQFAKAHTMDAPRAFEPRFEVPTEMQNWIHRMIQKAPEDRFQCAADAAHALRHLRDTLADAPQGRVIPDAIEPTPVTGRGALVSDTLIERPQTTQIIDPSNTQNHHINFEASSAAIVAGEPLAIRHPPMPVSWRRGVTAPPSMRLLGAGLGLFGLRSVPLVGRDHERDVIWAKLREVRESRKPQVIIIRGGAGTGKSRLAQWMARRAHETGVADVLHAAHSGMGGPTDGLGRMLARHTRCVGLRREEIHDRARQVLQLKPHTREIDPRAFVDFVAPSGIEVALSTGLSTVGTSTDQRFGLLRKFLAVSSAERPFVIVLDDVQWGSEALMFTQYLLERADSQPVPALLVLTVREESLVFRELEDAMIQAVEASPRTTALRLEGLSAAEIDHLVRELLYLDGDLADEIEDRSGGNPLFAVQMVGDLVSRGKLQFGPQGFVLRASEVVEIPDDIHTLWHSRVFRILAHRPSADAIALEIGAALGVEVDREEWALACEVLGIVPPHDLIGVMQAEGLVTRSESGWSFSHGLLRESVQRGSAGAGRWEAVNAACVEMLFRRYPRREYPFHDRMARHLEDANEREAALVHRVAAADDRVERCEFDDAAGHIRVFWNHAQALAVPASDPRRGQAMLIESRMALQQGHLAEALRQAENAAIDARKHKWPMLSLAEVTQAECHLARLEFDKASNMFTRATEEGTGEVLARAVLGLGRVRQGQGRYDEATRQIDGARQQFAALGVHLGQARCLNALGDVMRETKRYREARDYSRDAMRLFEQLGELTGVADCQNDLADLFRLEGQIDKGIEWCLKAIQLYESVGSDESMSARNTLGLLLRDAKRPQEALVVFAQVAQHFSATRNPQGFAVAALHAISCHAMLGDWDEIEAVLQSAREPLRALKVAPYDAGASIGVAFAHASQPRATQVLSPLARLHQEHQRKVW